MDGTTRAKCIEGLRGLLMAHGADEGSADQEAKRFWAKYGERAPSLLQPFFDLGWRYSEFMRWQWNKMLVSHTESAPRFERALLEAGCPPGFARAATRSPVLLRANQPDRVAGSYWLLLPLLHDELTCRQALNRSPRAFLVEPDVLKGWIKRIQEDDHRTSEGHLKFLCRFEELGRKPRDSSIKRRKKVSPGRNRPVLARLAPPLT